MHLVLHSAWRFWPDMFRRSHDTAETCSNSNLTHTKTINKEMFLWMLTGVCDKNHTTAVKTQKNQWQPNEWVHADARTGEDCQLSSFTQPPPFQVSLHLRCWNGKWWDSFAGLKDGDHFKSHLSFSFFLPGNILLWHFLPRVIKLLTAASLRSVVQPCHRWKWPPDHIMLVRQWRFGSRRKRSQY